MKGTAAEMRVLYSTGEDEVKYVRKKAPLTPDWRSCFDAHLYPGRMFELIVMQRPEKKVGAITVSAQSLSDHCKSVDDIATVWVNIVRLQKRCLKIFLPYIVIL